MAFVSEPIEQDWIEDEDQSKLNHVFLRSLRTDDAPCSLTP